MLRHRLLSLGLVVPALALAMGCTSTVGDDGPFGQNPEATVIGDLAPNPTRVEVIINTADGFAEPYHDDIYVVDVSGRQVSFNEGVPAAIDQAALDDFVGLVAATPYRTIDYCVSMHIDGGRFPPKIRVTEGAESHTFGVNNDPCAESDHDHGDEVLYGEDYQVIYDAVQDLMPPLDSSAS